MSSVSPISSVPSSGASSSGLSSSGRPTSRASSTASLSPSRAGDFMTCPLLYRFRVIDRLPEPPSKAATRGTVVHSVLERLYDLPREERTLDAATQLVEPSWAALLADDPAVAELFETGAPEYQVADWLAGTDQLLQTYFSLEDPTRLEPAERELGVEVTLSSGLTLRGYIDRLDVTPSGDMRVVDYKTGRSPGEAFQQRALFQMRFYALALWRLRGEVPRMLQLIYLGNAEVIRYEPDETDLMAMERKVIALWEAIKRADANGDWRPNRTRLCDWCHHKPLCPAWDGTPPPLPAHADVAARDDDRPAATASPVDI